MSDELNDKTTENIILEYSTLRSEIIKRIELRQQILSITLTITGVFLGFGINNGTIAFILPPLILFLVIAWTQNDIRIRDAGVHIQNNIESKVPGLQWETNLQKERETTGNIKWRRTILSHGGVFIFAQLIAIFIGVFQVDFGVFEIVLVSIDGLSVMFTFLTLRNARR